MSLKLIYIYFFRVSLDQSETTLVTESDMTPVSSNRVNTTQQSVSTSRQIEADDLDLEFNAMSVDPMGLHLKRNDSGLFLQRIVIQVLMI